MIATTACFVASYDRAESRQQTRDARGVHDVAFALRRRRIGRNARTPWITPQRFTPITHVHADSGPNHGSPLDITPALLHTTCTVPKRSTVGRRERLHRRLVAHVGADGERVDAARADLLGGGREPGLVDVGEHHVHTRRREPIRQREPDPARRARDDRDLARLELHLLLPACASSDLLLVRPTRRESDEVRSPGAPVG